MAKSKKDQPALIPESDQVTADASAPEEALETAFERRIGRLTEIAEEAEFESGSLLGDIRDLVVDLFKQRPKPWSQHSEHEQRDLVKGIEATARVIIKKLVTVIAEEDEISVHATLNGYGVDGDTFKIKATAKGDEETAIQLFRLDGHEVVLVSADSKRFNGQRKDPDVQADQLGMGFADVEKKDDGKPSGGEGPEGDVDLAGEEGESVTVRDEVGNLVTDENELNRIARTGDKIEVEGHGLCELEVNLKTGMVEATPLSGSALEKIDLVEASPLELAAERERIADDVETDQGGGSPLAAKEDETA